jgi:hypothetical protein
MLEALLNNHTKEKKGDGFQGNRLLGCEITGTGSATCPVMGFGDSGIEFLVSATRESREHGRRDPSR